MKAALVLGLLLAGSQEFGEWVTTEGKVEVRPCPVGALFGQEKALKLPAGCQAQAPGVFLSVGRFSGMQAQIGGLTKRASQLEAELETARTALLDATKKSASALRSCADELDQARERAEQSPWEARAHGFVFGALACGATWLRSEWR